MIRKLLVVLLLTGAAFAQMEVAPQPPRERHDEGRRNRGMVFERGMGPMMPGGKFWNNTEVAQKLGLTSAQVQQMEKIFQDSRLKLIDQVATVQKAEVMLEPMLQADRPDENQVLAQIDKIAQARAELEKTNARMMLGIRQVLSVDQWNKLKAEMPRRGPGPGEPHERRQERGGERGPQGAPGQPAPPSPPPTPPDSE